MKAQATFADMYNKFGSDFDRFVRAQMLTLVSGTKDVLMRFSSYLSVSIDFVKLDRSVLDKLKDKQILVGLIHSSSKRNWSLTKNSTLTSVHGISSTSYPRASCSF